MKVHRVEQPEWFTNSYLVVDEASRAAVLIDGNGVTDPLLRTVEAEGLDLTHILLTHEHWDHVIGVGEIAAERGIPVLAHEFTAAVVDFPVAETLEDREVLKTGGLEIEAISTPGHSDGHLAFLANGSDLFTADSIFKGTVGGTMLPGTTGFPDLKGAIMERLLTLPGETVIHPGHRGPSTVAEEWEQNPFVRVWRGLDPEGDEPCEVNDRGPAELVLWAPDYDGTNKAWVRFPDGSEGIIGGSQVTR